MNVGELIHLLQQQDPATKVVIEADHGYNTTRSLEGVTVAPLKNQLKADYGEKLSADSDYAGPAEAVIAITSQQF